MIMSAYVKVSDITNEERENLEKACIKLIGKKSQNLCTYSIDRSVLSVPFATACHVLKKKQNVGKIFPPIDIEFTGILRDYQRQLRKDAVYHLNNCGSVLLKLHCGAGKTCLAINIATKIKLKTLIVVHRVVLMKQWIESIKTFTSSKKIQVIKANEDLSQDVDFYVINVVNIFKHSTLDFFNIGLVIFDECHIMGSEKAINAFKLFSPKYIIGLSATPERNDGMHNLIEMYIGNSVIEKKMEQNHVFYKIKHVSENDYSNDKYVNQTTQKLEWNKIINDQAMDTKRNNMISQIIIGMPERIFIVLCKRVEQCYFLQTKLKQHDVYADIFTGNSKNANYNARVLVSTFSKTGEGFDHPNLDTLIVATDVKTKIEQYHGRIFRRKDAKPIVIDIVDDFGPFHGHFNSRKNYYMSSGGVMRNFDRDYPHIFKDNFLGKGTNTAEYHNKITVSEVINGSQGDNTCNHANSFVASRMSAF